MELVNYGTRMGEITVALHNIDEINRMEPVPEPVSPKVPESFEVQFHDVSFSYQDTTDPSHTLALSHISFTAPQKQMTTLVGPSGGEAQRLAIARSILKDSPIVIFDEALAYSDAENENLILQAIDKLIENRTVIIIAHRLPII
ncbi:ATP-binding cassette domain-containing protein [Oscillibacter sp.]|uniref:ATP-binding cassette domain-containing protein n=1 Tax=Oscillibacter sp. TaxID=1945593 RepID=UPI0028A293DF|nr:ATP-binding cassette domain-containing protein [Oscillibacter sp.]